MIECELRPRWPLRLPTRGGRDGVTRVEGGVITRLLHIDGRPVVTRIWRAADAVRIRAEAADPGRAAAGSPPRLGARAAALPARTPATEEQLELAVERIRFALGIDEDLREFCEAFRADPLIGTAIRRRPWSRPKRRPFAWEALAWAITEQLIEVERAGQIQRRMVRRWGRRLERDHGAALADVPEPAAVAARAPAEITALDLTPSRSIAMIRVAREVASGRVDPADPDCDRRLAAISGVGPWTLQVLGQSGRGEHDTLPAGDLAYVKLVGRLAGLGRRAAPEEVEEFFAPYAPFRGLAGHFALGHYHLGVEAGPPARLAA